VRIGIFALWPFGRTVVRRADAGAGSAIGNVLWFLLAGWWLIVGHLVTGALLCLTIIGIPLGLANFKLIPVTFCPFGRDIVSIEEAERQGLPRQVTMPANAPRPEPPGGAASRLRPLRLAPLLVALNGIDYRSGLTR
jgi:inner membrane component-like transport protein